MYVLGGTALVVGTIGAGIVYNKMPEPPPIAFVAAYGLAVIGSLVFAGWH